LDIFVFVFISFVKLLMFDRSFCLRELKQNLLLHNNEYLLMLHAYISCFRFLNFLSASFLVEAATCCDNCIYALARHLCLVIQEIYMSGYAYFHVKLNAILSIFLVQLRPSKIAKRKKRCHAHFSLMMHLINMNFLINWKSKIH
jgi:hypothetical protein